MTELSVRRCWVLAMTALVMGAGSLGAAGVDPQPLIAGELTALDTGLAGAAAGFDMAGSATYARRLNAIADKYTVVVSLLLVNAKGKVVAEVAREGQPGKAGRSVAGQAWFQTAGVKRAKHHGSLQPPKGQVALFWAMPVGPGPKAGGALAARIDLVKVFEAVTKARTVPFVVLAGGKELFSQGWSEGLQADERQLTVPGLEGAVLRIDAGALAKAADTVKPAEAESAAAEPASGVKVPGGAISDAEAKKLMKVVLPIAAAVLAGLAIVLIIFVVQSRKGRRHEKLMMDFEEDISGTPPSAPPRPPQAAPGARQPPPTRVAAPPLAQAGRPVSRPTERVVVPPEIISSGPQPAHVADPQTRTAAGPGPVVNPETYEQLRQQITREITDSLRAEMRKEFEGEQRRTQAKAEVFYRTIHRHLDDLVRQMGEAESSWTELSTAVKNCGFKLKQALDGLGQGKT